jgi:hypothetical protein
VRYEGQTVGRIYRTNNTGLELWRWATAPTHGPNGGVAEPLNAKFAFRCARDADRWLPRPILIRETNLGHSSGSGLGVLRSIGC